MTSEEGSEAPERECAGAEQRQRQAQDVSQVNKELVAELERRAEGRTAELESTLAQARAAESQRLAAEEELREAHLDIVRAREDAEVRHNEAESLLEGLRSLTEALDVERVFAGMLDVLRGLLAFEHAFILTSHTTNELKAIHATDPIFESSVWQTKRYFQRVLAGKTLAAFDTTQIPEWQAQSPRLHTQAVSALHIPLRTGEEWAMLVCTHTARGFFVKEHVLLAQRFSVLAAHALRNAELHAALKAERDTLEARVRERTEEIRSLAKFPEENPYPILRVAAGGQILYSNRAGVDFLASLGCDTDGNVPEPWHPIIRQVLQSGEPVEAESQSGERVFSCTFAPVVADGYVNVYGLDVTKRVQAEEEKENLQAQLLQSQKMEAVGQLTAGIAHDFNNLLTAINGFAQLIQFRLAPDDPIQEMVGKIWDAGQRAAGLVSQLMAFSRKQIIDPQVLDLNAVVADMEDMLRRVIREDVELEMVPAPDLWPVKVDPAQMEQAIINLAVNAADAMPGGGKLTIETSNVVLDEDYVADHLEAEPGEHVLLAVSDTGVGMSQEVQARIFEPFFTTKERGEGTGLGLASAYGVVKQNGGDIWVYSQEGQGTIFKIYLPRAEESAELSPRAEGARAMPAGGETILLVEDTFEVRNLARQVLERQGYTLLEAGDGQQALALAASHAGPIHLLLTDVIMPGMSGKALSEELVQSHPDARVLYMSGYTDNTIEHHGVLGKSTAFLQKPFNAIDLARKVRGVLDGPQR